jgi:hypothetical protein
VDVAVDRNAGPDRQLSQTLDDHEQIYLILMGRVVAGVAMKRSLLASIPIPWLPRSSINKVNQIAERSINRVGSGSMIHFIFISGYWRAPDRVFKVTCGVM